MPKPLLHVKIIPFIFKDELACRGISIRSLENPESPNYIGVSSRTIHRGLKDGYFTRKTIEALSDIIETDNFIVDFDYEDIEQLTQKNDKLIKEVEKLKNENKLLKSRLLHLQATVQSVLKSCSNCLDML